MKNDKLLKHQLKRLYRIIEQRNQQTGFRLTGDAMWFDKASAMVHQAICRSLQRTRL